jgi:hypothetical protein
MDAVFCPSPSRPCFFDRLSADGKREYLDLLHYISTERCSLSRTLDLIHCFCVRNTESDWKRSVVCGVCWLPSGQIASNYKQMSHFIGSSKSAFFGGLRAMGYSPTSHATRACRLCTRAREAGGPAAMVISKAAAARQADDWTHTVMGRTSHM